MRVIAGTARGMKLRAPSGTAVRPTADRVKEALFNILADGVDGARVLDLFAGSGALGIEALSRGAASCVFVDKRAACMEAVRDNLTRTRLLGRAELIVADAFRTMRRLASEGRTFDLVFADPPYEQGLCQTVVEAVAQGGLLAPGGRLVVEHGVREDINPQVENLEHILSRSYGDTVITIFITR